METSKLKMAFTFLAVIMLGFSLQNGQAQGKPKGKPWNAPESAVKMKNAVKSDDSSIKEGKELYSQHCKSCHGSKGIGDGPKSEKIDISCGDFTTPEFAKEADGAVYWKTTEGRKPMPSFKEELSDNERWALVNYIRTLSAAK